MKQLPEIVELKVGISNLTAKLIKHTNKTAMYLRADGYYEIGTIKRNAKDYTFPSGSIIEKGAFMYWNDEDFGKIAKTTSNKERAFELFNEFELSGK